MYPRLTLLRNHDLPYDVARLNANSFCRIGACAPTDLRTRPSFVVREQAMSMARASLIVSVTYARVNASLRRMYTVPFVLMVSLTEGPLQGRIQLHFLAFYRIHYESVSFLMSLPCDHSSLRGETLFR